MAESKALLPTESFLTLGARLRVTLKHSPMSVLKAFKALERALDGDLSAPASAQAWKARAEGQSAALANALVDINLQGSHEQRVQAVK